MNTTPCRYTPKTRSIRPVLALTVVVTATAFFAAPALAEGCPSQATVGNFDLTFEGAELDAGATVFTYCITGLDVPGFHALSNWELALDPSCIEEDELLSCEPGPCYYQEDDPNTGITGIKFDNLEVEAGETQCFAFALEGDWTDMLGEVTVGLKAATDVDYGNICGPICHNCSSALDVLTRADAEPLFNVRVTHNQANTVVTPIWYTVIDAAGHKIHNWRDGAFRFTPHSTYRYFGQIPGLPELEPGKYTFVMRLQAMGGWARRTTEFSIR